MSKNNLLSDLSTQTKAENAKSLVSKKDDPHWEPKTEDTYASNNSRDLTAFYTKGIPTKSDVQVNLTITLVNINDNCKPLAHTNVEIVHRNKCIAHNNQCSSAGMMSDPFFAEMLMTDASGKIHLTTVYSGLEAGYCLQCVWEYITDLCCLRLRGFAFFERLADTVYITSSVYTPYAAKTSEVYEPADIFSENVSGNTYEMLTISANSSGGYDVKILLGISISETEVMKLKINAAGQVALNRKYPEPFSDTTTISFSLNEPSEISLIVFDDNGNKITEVIDKLNTGNHTIIWNKESEGISLPAANYVYHLNVQNSKGKYRQVRVVSSF